jgi:hypothetical protein
MWLIRRLLKAAFPPASDPEAKSIKRDQPIQKLESVTVPVYAENGMGSIDIPPTSLKNTSAQTLTAPPKYNGSSKYK